MTAENPPRVDLSHGTPLPLPPLHLANRVGALHGDDPLAQYNLIGRRTRIELCAVLPEHWTWRDRRILDLGCGAGRTLRHFVQEAHVCEFYGCDIDVESVDWLRGNLCPPFRCFANGEFPPLDFAPASFDLVYAISVFTHLTASWSAWLLEVHRLLRPGALALVTFMGRGMWNLIAGERLAEDEVGMLTLKAGQLWDHGGPMVLHSPWWIEEHWGRVFEIVGMRPDGFAWAPGIGQGIVALRKREVSVTVEDLERIEPGDVREVNSLQTAIRLLYTESGQRRNDLAWSESRRQDAEREIATLRERLRAMESSRSWRFMGPLRGLRRIAGRVVGQRP